MVPLMLARDLVSLDLASTAGTEVPGVNLEVQDVMRVLDLAECHGSVAGLSTEPACTMLGFLLDLAVYIMVTCD